MNRLNIPTIVLIFVSTTGGQQETFPRLRGPYLGREPPVSEAVLFAPGIVSSPTSHSSVAISTDGNEMYWSGEKGKIWFTALRNGVWLEPEIVSFCRGTSYEYDNPFLTPDGSKMFLTSFRPGGYAKNKEAIWYAERSPEGWTDPNKLGPAVNDTPLHWSISVSGSGTLYFGGGDIYRSHPIDGEYASPVRLGTDINTSAVETCPYIAPDESYLVFTRFDQTNPRNTGIFISVRDSSGKFLPPRLVLGGDKKSGGMSPRISPDGKYVFYVNGGMWWKPAAFLDGLQPVKQ